MDELKRKANRNHLQLSMDNMQKYIGDPATLRIVQSIPQNDANKGSKTTCPNAMEERVHFS